MTWSRCRCRPARRGSSLRNPRSDAVPARSHLLSAHNQEGHQNCDIIVNSRIEHPPPEITPAPSSLEHRRKNGTPARIEPPTVQIGGTGPGGLLCLILGFLPLRIPSYTRTMHILCTYVHENPAPNKLHNKSFTAILWVL